jgi:tetratricopeptide (TPR) repeat protein
LGGLGAWSAGFARQEAISTQYALDTQIALGKITPTITDSALEAFYQRGVTAYRSKDYPSAITQLDTVVRYRPYKDAAAYLLLSYKSQGDLQAGQPDKLTVAPLTYATGLELVKNKGPEVMQGFQRSPDLLGTTTYPTLITDLQNQQVWADHYSKGNTSASFSGGVDWWDRTIPEWELVYQTNPGYLKDNALLALNQRLADVYKTKALDLCRVKGDYAGALSAVNRGLEITYKSKLSETKQSILLNLYYFITQNQCQAG